MRSTDVFEWNLSAGIMARALRERHPSGRAVTKWWIDLSQTRPYSCTKQASHGSARL